MTKGGSTIVLELGLVTPERLSSPLAGWNLTIPFISGLGERQEIESDHMAGDLINNAYVMQLLI